MLVHLERQEAATHLLFEHQLSHAAGGLRGVPKVQDKIIAAVAPQSVACQRSNPSETILEILCGQRAGDWWIMCRHVRLPLLFSRQRRIATKAQIASTSPNGQAPWRKP
jgi:hypothetical protein